MGFSRETYYKEQKWLNPPNSPSTGSVVCYDGMIDYSDGPDRCTFLEIADCHNKARLHKAHTDTIEDFRDKVELLYKEIGAFLEHLKLAE